MSFAAEYPYLINRVVLLAPGGILRRLPAEYEWFCFRYPWLFSENYLKRRVGQVLGVSPRLWQGKFDQVQTVLNEEERLRVSDLDKLPDVASIVQWQYDNHVGFVHSFVDTIRHGPLKHEHEIWKHMCAIIKGTKKGCRPGTNVPSRLCDSKLLVVYGDEDTVVVGKELIEDLEAIFGDNAEKHLIFQPVPGTHGFPVPSCDAVMKLIVDTWQVK